MNERIEVSTKDLGYIVSKFPLGICKIKETSPGTVNTILEPRSTFRLLSSKAERESFSVSSILISAILFRLFSLMKIDEWVNVVNTRNCKSWIVNDRQSVERTLLLM